ncbi:MAG TPA: dihydroneopterin aldolase [Candidatus Limnocylindria bacterium]|jgi:7,8-dihydroneopterin aldolase/epimerase/oxygenase|nr:dihydroneopterin aldolase [Candidatus Limnocylindria bacterium]
MSDAIFLRGMVFEGHHGVTDEERAERQPIALSVELSLDLQAAGQSDALAETVDYGAVFELCRETVEERSFRLLEGLAEALASALLARYERLSAVVVEASKPGVPLAGIVEHAGVRVGRARAR